MSRVKSFPLGERNDEERRVVELIGADNDGKLLGDYLWLIMECAPVISAKHTRFRDNRRLTMTLPLVNTSRLSTKGLLPASPDPGSPIYQRPSVSRLRYPPTGDYHHGEPYHRLLLEFFSPNELIISGLSPPSLATPPMIIRGYDNAP